MNSHQEDFYLKLGSLAIQFSTLEYYTSTVLSRLIAKDDELVGATITKRMQFAQKIELIKELADLRSEHGEDLLEVIGHLNSMRKTRNQLIHGLWHEPQAGETGYSVTVEEFRLKKTKEQTENGKLIKWNRKQFQTYPKGRIERLSVEVHGLIKRMKDLVNKLEEDLTL